MPPRSMPEPSFVLATVSTVFVDEAVSCACAGASVTHASASRVRRKAGWVMTEPRATNERETAGAPRRAPMEKGRAFGAALRASGTGNHGRYLARLTTSA